LGPLFIQFDHHIFGRLAVVMIRVFQPKDFLLTSHTNSNRQYRENGAESGFAGEIAAMQLY
jgi:hypothetical protein